MTTVNVTYYGMEGSGRNVTDAKRDAGGKIERAMSGSYTPELIVCGKYAILLFRAPTGWGSRLITDESGAIRQDLGGKVFASCYDDYETAKLAAVHHVAQCGMDWRNILCPSDVPSIVTCRAMRSDLHRYAAWQRCYRYAAKILGFDSNSAHAYACEHSSEWFDRPWTSEAIVELAA